jgi:hypothetical protein
MQGRSAMKIFFFFFSPFVVCRKMKKSEHSIEPGRTCCVSSPKCESVKNFFCVFFRAPPNHFFVFCLLATSALVVYLPKRDDSLR